MQPNHRRCAIICQTVHSITDQPAKCANLIESGIHMSLPVHFRHASGVSHTSRTVNRTLFARQCHRQSHTVTIRLSIRSPHIHSSQFITSITIHHMRENQRIYAQSPCLRAVMLVFTPKIQRIYAHMLRLRADTLVCSTLLAATGGHRCIRRRIHRYVHQCIHR